MRNLSLRLRDHTCLFAAGRSTYCLAAAAARFAASEHALIRWVPIESETRCSHKNAVLAHYPADRHWRPRARALPQRRAPTNGHLATSAIELPTLCSARAGARSARHRRGENTRDSALVPGGCLLLSPQHGTRISRDGTGDGRPCARASRYYERQRTQA